MAEIERLYGACIDKTEDRTTDEIVALMEASSAAQIEICTAQKGKDVDFHSEIDWDSGQPYCIGRMDQSLAKQCEKDPTLDACGYYETYKSMGLSPKHGQICCLFKIDTSKITCK